MSAASYDAATLLARLLTALIAGAWHFARRVAAALLRPPALADGSLWLPA
ncbi:MAG TPA: hypothetical protein VJN44_16720 [Roseateles sp.]|nr:hypothetical protein [Roseateles sp.]